jgi:hypothetical protein
MADAHKRRRNGRIGMMARAAISVVALAATAALSTAGAAQAIPARHTPARIVSLPGSAGHASAASEPGKPAGCFSGSSPCASSDPDVSLGFVSGGDTSGCTFKFVIQWGDKSADTTVTLTGGTDGTKYGPYSHTYHAKPGAYEIDWTSTLESNTGFQNCLSSTGSDEFVLVTAGIYADFSKKSEVETAVKDGWSLIANVAGKGKPSGCKSPWTAPTNNHSDSNVEQVLSAQSTHYPACGRRSTSSRPKAPWPPRSRRPT